MAPLIIDGKYKIRNGEYNRMVAALNDRNPYGPIVAQDAHYNRRDEWRIRNVGNGGNQVIIESASRIGIYAYPARSGSDSLVGSGAEMVWTVVKVDSGMYYLQSPDATRVWELPRGIEGQDILLVHHTGQKNTKWTFEPLAHLARA